MSGILQMVFAAMAVSSAPINTVAPVVTGTAQVRQTLSCTTGTWTSSPPITGYTYQWQFGTTNIPGATSSTYTINSAYVGTTIRCIVTASNSVGSSSATSNATSAVAANISVAPTIGTASVLTATSASVSFTANDNGGASVTSFTAISSPGGITGTSTGSPITVSGLSSSTAYTFTVTATNSVGTSAASAASNSITTGSLAPSNTAIPVISGIAVVRQTLSCTTGSWTNSPTSFNYYWFSGAPGFPGLQNSASNTLVIPSSAVGNQIYCYVSATNSFGTGNVNANPTSTVTANTPEAPASVVITIDNPGTFPRRMTVTSSVPNNGGSTITLYNWFRSVNGGSFLSFTSTSGPVLVHDGIAGSSYAFKSMAVNSIGNGDQSPASNTVTLPAAVTINITISANTQDYNIFSNKGGTYVAGSSTINLTIDDAATVGGSSSYALNTGTGWVSGDVINVINNGVIAGKAGSITNSSSPSTAIYMSWPLSIANGGGDICSGGGAGGTGGDGGGIGGDGGGWRPWSNTFAYTGANGAMGILGAGGTGGGLGVAGGPGGADPNGSGGGGGGGGGGAAGGTGGAGEFTPGTAGQATVSTIITNGYALTISSGSSRIYGAIV